MLLHHLYTLCNYSPLPHISPSVPPFSFFFSTSPLPPLSWFSVFFSPSFPFLFSLFISIPSGRCSLHKSSRPHILRPSSGSINTGFSGHAMDPGPCLLMGCFAVSLYSIFFIFGSFFLPFLLFFTFFYVFLCRYWEEEREREIRA